MKRNDIIKYAEETHGTLPEYLFSKSPDTAIFRNESSNKWYGAIMSVPSRTLGLDGEGAVEILNVKCDPLMVGSLRMQNGFLPAYHMNKNSWISIMIEEDIPTEMIFDLLDISYELTK